MEFVNKAIVLDLDGVIANIDKSVSDHLFYTHGVSDEDYGSWFTTNTTDENALNLFRDKLFWRNMKPFEDAYFQVNYWFSLGIDVNIVTARKQPAAIEETAPWLDMWRINTSRPRFSEFGKKIDIIKQIDPLFVVEDNPHEIEILQEHGIKCYLRAAWYNQDYWNKMDTIESLFEIDLENL
jgi:hypothetical protein